MDTVKTGDVLLFSGNNPTGFLLRTFVSSEWNHTGIAVRFITDRDNNKTISLTEEGDLYVLETNTWTRRDAITGEDVLGAGFSKAEWAFQRYNRIAARRLHDVFRTQELADMTLDFADKYRGKRFPSSTLPFIGVWLGIPLVEKTNGEMFCSELQAHYYAHCIGPQYERLTGFPFNGSLAQLFGTGAPYSENMYTPGHYTTNNTPNASIFSGNETIIYTTNDPLLYVILQPFLLILLIVILIWYTLP